MAAQKAVICQTETAQVVYEAEGNFNADNKFRLYLRDLSTGGLTRLAELTALTGNVPLPPSSTRPPGNYALSIEATSPSLTVTAGSLTIQTPLQLRLLTEALSSYPVWYKGQIDQVTRG